MKQLPIYKILTENPQIVALLNDKVFEDIAPEKTKPPYLVWSDLTGTPNTSLDNITLEDQVLYQVVIYSAYQKQAADIRTEIAKILQEHSLIEDRFGTYEPQTRLFGRGFSGSWWLDR